MKSSKMGMLTKGECIMKQYPKVLTFALEKVAHVLISCISMDVLMDLWRLTTYG